MQGASCVSLLLWDFLKLALTVSTATSEITVGIWLQS